MLAAAAALCIPCGLGKAARTGLGSLPSVYSAVGSSSRASRVKDGVEALHPQCIVLHVGAGISCSFLFSPHPWWTYDLLPTH